MKDYIDYKLSNGIKLIYKNTTSHLSSISIALDAGAGRDFNDRLGIAHVTEHMIYKGTKNRTEEEINKELSNIFGFQNAMTNYPYVVYYGTLLGEDLSKGLELFADILINPLLVSNGFSEEMNVIKEELNEWDEEVEQYCEDKLFFNSFEKRRIKYPIIGTKESLNKILLSDVKEFYDKYYFPGNLTITVISSNTFEEVKGEVKKYFGLWEKEGYLAEEEQLESIKEDKYIAYRNDLNTAKVLITYSIRDLSIEEMKRFRLFNEYFGEGINSLLFDKLRTKNGLVYDVLTKIANENYIKLYKIMFSTAKENVSNSLEQINEIITDLNEIMTDISNDELKILMKKMKLRRYFYEEQSIRLANCLSTYDRMFGDYHIYLEEAEDMEAVSINEILTVAKKVLKNPAIQIIEK